MVRCINVLHKQCGQLTTNLNSEFEFTVVPRECNSWNFLYIRCDRVSIIHKEESKQDGSASCRMTVLSVFFPVRQGRIPKKYQDGHFLTDDYEGRTLQCRWCRFGWLAGWLVVATANAGKPSDTMEPVEIDHDDLADEYGEDYEDEDEHDAEPLMHDPSRAGAGAGGPSSSSSPSSRRRTGEQGGRRLSESLGAGDVLKWGGASWPQLLFLFLIVVMGMGYAIRLWVVDTTTTTSTPNSQEGGGPSSASPGSFYSKSSLSNDPDRPVPLLNVKNVDYQKVSTLRQRFLKAKDQYMEQLRQDYGPNNFNAMFVLNDVFVGRLALRSAHLVLPESHPISEYFETNDGTSQLVGGGSMGMSWDRMKRKMTMKILQLLHLSKMKRSKDAPLPPMIPFVWATGGHRYVCAGRDRGFGRHPSPPILSHPCLLCTMIPTLAQCGRRSR